MKKSLFIILTSLITPFMIASCASDENSDPNKSDGGKDNSSSIDFSKPETLQGTYDVTFFTTKPSSGGSFDMAAMGTMTTDCKKAGELNLLTPTDKTNPDAKTECKIDGALNKDTANIIGQQAAITYDKAKGITLETKLQIWKDVLGLSDDDTYQYTKYTTVPVANITKDGINTYNNNAVKGVSGRTLTKKSSNPNSTFKITKLADGNLYVELNLIDKVTMVGKVTAPTYVILKKKSDKVDPVDSNKLFKTETGITCEAEKPCPDTIYKKFKATPDEITE